MADIGKDRLNHDDEEPRQRKFTVVDKRITAEELEAAEAAPPPAEPIEPAAATPKEARTIKLETPPPAVHEPAPAPLAPPPPAPEPPAPADDERAAAAAAAGIDPDPLAVSNALLFFVEELFTRILIYLGLQPHPQTGLTIRNMEQAAKGIRLLEILVNEARRDASPEIDLYLDKLLTQMKAAYTQIIMGGVVGGPGGPGRGPLV